MLRRTLPSPVWTVVLGCAPWLAGCASLNPKGDFDRASRLVTDRAGVTDSYDAQTDALVDAKVEELLSGGLTVEKAVRIGLLNNPDFQAPFQQIGAFRADVVQSQLLTNPTFGITLLYPVGGGRPKIPFGIGQEIVDLWQIPVRKRIAEAQLEQVVLTVAQRGVDIANDTRAASYRLIALQEAEAIAERNVKRLERLQAEAAPPDSARFEVEALDARVTLATVRRDRRIARAALARMLGISRRDEAWELRDTLPSSAFVRPSELELRDYALTERLDAQARQMQVVAAEEQLQREWLDIFPRVGLGVGGEQKDTRGVPPRLIAADTARSTINQGKLALPAIQTKGQRDLAHRYIINFLFGPRFDVTVPIWDQNQAQIARFRYVVEQRRLERESLLDAIAQDVERAYAEVDAAAEQVRLYEQRILPKALANAAAEEDAYRSGKQPPRAFLDANRTLTTHRLAYLTAVRDHAVALASLQRAVGGKFPPSATQPTASAPG